MQQVKTDCIHMLDNVNICVYIAEGAFAHTTVFLCYFSLD